MRRHTLLAHVAGAYPSWQVSLANTGETAALGIQLEDARPPDSPGYPYFADNYFCLLPGESRPVEVAWGGPAGGRLPLALSAWNAIAPPLELC